MNAADHLQQAADELRRTPEGNWPGTYRSRSQSPQHQEALAREVEVRWLDPQGPTLTWLREAFPDHHCCTKGRHVRALSLDAQGRPVRVFTASDTSIATYAELLRQGAGTCPLEAVWPPSIAPGRPAMPAHSFLLPRMWEAIAASEGDPVEAPAWLDDLASAEGLQVAFRRGLGDD